MGVYKPVETGCARENGRLFGADARRLAAAAGGRQAESSITGYLFETPAAPLAAARTADEAIDPLRLERDIVAVDRAHGVTLVEGAGGLLVPIADDFTYLDLVRRLSLPVVVVVGSKLGCVNHALLTLTTLANAGARTLGYVLNSIAADVADAPSAESNRELIAAFSKTSCLGIFPHVPAGARKDDTHLARLAETSLDLDALMRR
ncbi:MAG TPA: dethiobiotin synthase [Candidatus Binatia bacterium]|nr:dethiobiotin synthase [Candidatus Binatia bacterium]